VWAIGHDPARVDRKAGLAQLAGVAHGAIDHGRNQPPRLGGSRRYASPYCGLDMSACPAKPIPGPSGLMAACIVPVRFRSSLITARPHTNGSCLIA
jgi:hypothetical protein